MADNITPRGFVIGYEKPDDDAESNKVVEALFYNFISRNIQAESLEFKKATILAALNAFDTKSFKLWFDNQFKSPYMSELHKEFLLDTLNYLRGKERKFDITTWDSIISREEIATNIQIDITEEDYNGFFGVSTGRHVRQARNNLVTDVLKLWFEKEDGVCDLVYTLFILFGAKGNPRART